MTTARVTAHDRAPDWKWRRILGIMNSNDVPTTPEWDTSKGFYWIQRGIEFRNSYIADDNPATNQDLLLKFADIYSAHRVFTDLSSNLRWEIEASILARVPTEEIAMSANMTASAMVAYEELFFDVRELLDKSMYIENYVIGSSLQNLKKDDIPTIWKHFAYHLGPEVLKALATRTVNPQYAQTADAVNSCLTEDIMGSFNLSCSVAAKSPSGGDRSNQHLLGLFAKFKEISKMEDMSNNSHQGQAREHIANALENLNHIISVGGMLPKSTQTTPAQPYIQNNTAEPNLSQLMEIAFTGKSESLDQTAGLKYPPVKKKDNKDSNG